jgi:hypothetical protein
VQLKSEQSPGYPAPDNEYPKLGNLFNVRISDIESDLGWKLDPVSKSLVIRNVPNIPDQKKGAVFDLHCEEIFGLKRSPMNLTRTEAPDFFTQFKDLRFYAEKCLIKVYHQTDVTAKCLQLENFNEPFVKGTVSLKACDRKENAQVSTASTSRLGPG